MEKIKVLVVDDSAVVRQSLTSILSSDPLIEVIGTAADPIFAVKKIMKETPDVITLDIEMPRMDGITFLRKIMSQHPIPVVVISTLTQRGTNTAMKALEYGAAEIIGKPSMNPGQFFKESQIMICDAVKAASKARLGRRKISTDAALNGVLPNKPNTVSPTKDQAKVSTNIPDLSASALTRLQRSNKIIAIGASTGGTEALRNLLSKLPAQMPGIAIVQHMPEGFTKSFAEGLNRVSALEVKEAENGDKITPGLVLIAPGNQHMLIKHENNEYFVEVRKGPLVNRHRPSVDVLFKSAARHVKSKCLGIILTGMGGDGAKGLLELKESGANTIAQDEKSSVVYGMPKVATDMGAVKHILSIDEIAPFLVENV